MYMDEIELKLLVGMPIEIDGCGYLHTPLVKEVIDIGQTKYNELLSVALLNKNKLKSESDLTTFQIIAYMYLNDENFQKKFSEAIKFFFKEEIHFGYNESEVFFYFGDKDENRWITQNNIEIIQAVLRVSNQVKVDQEDEDEYKPANEHARKLIEEMLERRKNKPKPKPTINLHSIISGLAWKSNNVSIFDIPNLTIYQLYDGFHRLENIDSYHYTLVGIYSGNVDGKKINLNNIHWTKIMNQQ